MYRYLFEESKKVIEPYAIELFKKNPFFDEETDRVQLQEKDEGFDFVFYDEEYPLGANVDVKAMSPRIKHLETAFIEIEDCYGKKPLEKCKSDYYMILRDYDPRRVTCYEWFLVPVVALKYIIEENNYEYVATRNSDNGKPCYGYRVPYKDIREISEIYSEVK